MLSAGRASANQFKRRGGCLYVFTVGEEKVEVPPECPDGDPLNLSRNADVGRVLQALGVRPHLIRFRGCEGGLFSAEDTELNPAADAARYAVSYRMGTTKYLAPITHELAHVWQMESVGGYRTLRDALPSRRIELAADYLTGIVFSQALRHLDLSEFQQNLSLRGLYYEADLDAHGTPVQRNNAFRLGFRLNFDSMNRDYRKASDDFQANVYGQLVQ
jgi:hypothetical protein